MIKFLKINIAYMFFFLLVFNAYAYSIDDKIEFAEYLAETNRPSHSLIEFERLLYFESDCNNRIKIVSSTLELYENNMLMDKKRIPYIMARLHECCHDMDCHIDTISFLEVKADTILGNIDLNKQYAVPATLPAEKIKEALRSRLKYLYETDNISKNTIQDKYYLNKAKNFESRYKRFSPTKAKILEAVIPGGGHFYLQNYNDALTSLFFKSVLIGSSIFFFQDGNYFAGAGTGLAGGVFYVGSVYSAGKGATELNNLYSDAFASSFVDSLPDDHNFILPIFNFSLEF